MRLIRRPSAARWCVCKRMRADGDGLCPRCGLGTQGGDGGPIPIDVRSALRDSAATGTGTPGDGIGRAGDPAPTLSVSGATPGVFVKASRENNRGNGCVESWKDAPVAPTLNGHDNTGSVRATMLTLAEMAECGCCPADPKPDSARYRACGNAVTVPVIQWIGERLLDARDDL